MTSCICLYSRDITQRLVERSRLENDLAVALGGSFSAEHGVGLFKRRHLERYRGGIEIELMRALKQTLDPRNTLNPGKVI